MAERFIAARVTVHRPPRGDTVAVLTDRAGVERFAELGKVGRSVSVRRLVDRALAGAGAVPAWDMVYCQEVTPVACRHTEEEPGEHWVEDRTGGERRVDCGCPCEACRAY